MGESSVDTCFNFLIFFVFLCILVGDNGTWLDRDFYALKMLMVWPFRACYSYGWGWAEGGRCLEVVTSSGPAAKCSHLGEDDLSLTMCVFSLVHVKTALGPHVSVVIFAVLSCFLLCVLNWLGWLDRCTLLCLRL